MHAVRRIETCGTLTTLAALLWTMPVATAQETIGIVDDQMVKASHGLSGGGAPFGEGVCGTLTGGLLALSAKYGRDRDKPDKGRYINNVKKAKKLTERFRAEFGGIACRELQQ